MTSKPLMFLYFLIIPERFNYSMQQGLGRWDSGRSEAHHPAIFEERSGMMQTAMKAKSPEIKPFQADSGLAAHIGDVSKTTKR